MGQIFIVKGLGWVMYWNSNEETIQTYAEAHPELIVAFANV